ncbi:hypothetical protein BDZ45DRAFT_749095 [Acephala macrosclerotiorum]|nr:hypothetical protein BDZ45DRAFT_749095 [Acephala macrosclerotiorum]
MSDINTSPLADRIWHEPSRRWFPLLPLPALQDPPWANARHKITAQRRAIVDDACSSNPVTEASLQHCDFPTGVIETSTMRRREWIDRPVITILQSTTLRQTPWTTFLVPPIFKNDLEYYHEAVMPMNQVAPTTCATTSSRLSLMVVLAFFHRLANTAAVSGVDICQQAQASNTLPHMHQLDTLNSACPRGSNWRLRWSGWSRSSHVQLVDTSQQHRDPETTLGACV